MHKLINLIMVSSTLFFGSCISNKVTKSLAPNRQLPPTALPAQFNLKTEDISFQTRDSVLIKAWWIAGENDAVIIISHSFGANRTGWVGTDKSGQEKTINWLPSVKILADAGYNILMLDHRACGESNGSITGFGKTEALDIEAALLWTIAHKKKRSGGLINTFGLIGFSSGANACLLAAEKFSSEKRLTIATIAVNVYWYEKMIAKSTKYFTDVPLVLLPLIKKATKKVVGFDPSVEIRPTKTVASITTPLLLVNAQHDEIASVQDIRTIFNAARQPKEIVILENENRFDAYHFIENHSSKTLEFLNKHLLNKPTKALYTPENTAFLYIEFQKTWTERSIFHALIKKEFENRNVLENALRLASFARSNGYKIFQAPLILDKTQKETYKKTPFFARLLNQFEVDTWKAEFTAGIVDNNDIIIENRYSYDACKGSNLIEKLTANGIKNIMVCGFTTDHCIKESILSLQKQGFNCVLVSDCTATMNRKKQTTIRGIAP
ncbi:MAG: isochorismatase family protein [Bacteroidales bacterium]|nr:isochorismatase family protein [Bacteroidales bacterium]